MKGKTLWRLLCVACVLSLAAAALAQPAGRVLLRFKFISGHVDALNLSVTGYGEMALSGLPGAGDLKLPVRIWLSAPVSLITRSVDAEGNGTLGMSLGAVGLEVMALGRTTHLSLGAGPGPVTLNNEGITLPGAKVAEALKQLSLVISPQGKVLAVNGLDQFAQVTQIPAAALLAGLSQEDMLDVLRSRVPVLPAMAVRAGDNWTQTMVLPLPGGQTVVSPLTSTLEKIGTEDGHELARVGVSGSLELNNIPLPAQPAGAQMKGMPALPAGTASTLDDLTVQATGEIYIPLDGGYLHSARMSVDVTLETSTQLPASLGGTTLHASLQDMKIFYDLTPRK